MKNEITNNSEIKLVGLTVLTNNKNEINSNTAKIGKLAGRFWAQNIANQITNRKPPGVWLYPFIVWKHGILLLTSQVKK